MATIGYGSRFGITDGAGGYTNVAEVIGFNLPVRTRTAVDATHMQSPDGYMEFIAGMKNGGTFSINIAYTPAVSDVIVAAFEAGLQGYQFTHPNGVRLQINAIMTSDAPEAPLDDRMTRSCEFQVSGKPVILAAV